MAQVTVKLFANLKELAGTDSITIDCEEGISLEMFTKHIVEAVPSMKDILEKRRVFISINQEMAQKNDTVNGGDEIALLPPFSGG